MPVDYKVSEDGEFVHARVTGIVTASEVIAYARKVEQDPGIKSNVKFLFDTTGISGSEVTNEQILEIARVVINNEGRTYRNKVAILVNRQDSEERAEQYANAMPAAKETVQVFHDLLIAKSWLGLESIG